MARYAEVITNLISRMKAKTVKVNNCWRFTGAHASGYGYIKVNGKITGVHVIAFEKLVRPLKNGEQVNHIQECPNRDCWNPEHLYAGTQQQNVHDMLDIGTHVSGFSSLKNQAPPSAKLVEEDIRRIRKLYPKYSMTRIGKKYGVSHVTISDIISGKSWKWVN